MFTNIPGCTYLKRSARDDLDFSIYIIFQINMIGIQKRGVPNKRDMMADAFFCQT